MNNQCYAFSSVWPSQMPFMNENMKILSYLHFRLFSRLSSFNRFSLKCHEAKPRNICGSLNGTWCSSYVAIFWSAFVLLHICTFHFHYVSLSICWKGTYFLNFSLSIPDEVYILWVVEICLIIPKCFDNKSNIKAENIANNDLV